MADGDQHDSIDVVLVTGPGGSGKTTLAGALADRLGWTAISEDDHWSASRWGPGLRTPEQEAIVQGEVLALILDAHRAGRGAVLDLILYRPAPNPLTAYRAALDAVGLNHDTIALAPSVETILARQQARGRPTDLADVAGRRLDAEWQLGCVRGDDVGAGLLVDDDRSTAAITDAWIAGRSGEVRPFRGDD